MKTNIFAPDTKSDSNFKLWARQESNTVSLKGASNQKVVKKWARLESNQRPRGRGYISGRATIWGFQRKKSAHSLYENLSLRFKRIFKSDNIFFVAKHICLGDNKSSNTPLSFLGLSKPNGNFSHFLNNWIANNLILKIWRLSCSSTNRGQIL